MKTVYRAANITEADIVAGMLHSRGIEAEVAGRHLQTAVGAAAMPYSSRVLVSEQQYEEARAVVAEYENNQPVDEQQKPERTPFAALGMFTKPVLFWVSVFLLLVWFFFSGVPSFDQWSGDVIFWEEDPAEWEEGVEVPVEGLEALEEEFGDKKDNE